MKYKKLQKDFYLKPCLTVAKELIGKQFVRIKGSTVYSGIITETEAYLGSLDAASHAYKGLTERNRFMFSEGGIAYVYFTYGCHYCINAVTGKAGKAHAVLIRSLEPVEGIEEMIKNRGTDNIYQLCSGPGRLTQAMSIGKNENGISLSSNEIFIAEPDVKSLHKITRTKRIGITKNADKMYRFIDSLSPFVSGVNYRKILKEQNKAIGI